MGLNRTENLEDNNDKSVCPTCGLQEDDRDHMIECSMCKLWFHHTCANIGEQAENLAMWTCVKCSVVPSSNSKGQGLQRHSTAKSVASHASSSERRKFLMDQLNNSRALQSILEKERAEKEREKHVLDELLRFDDAMSLHYAERKKVESLHAPLISPLQGVAPDQRPPNEDPRKCQSEPFGGAHNYFERVSLRGAYDPQRNYPPQNDRIRNDPHRNDIIRNASHVNARSIIDSEIRYAPTQQQLAARHTLGKDLPKFSGKPRDWPIFMSSFTESTKACGYTHTENLVRLQKCLQDPAKKMVESCLRKADYVPVILETLRKLYGRPELIINDLVAQIRAHPTPKSDKLDTIVSYSVQVHNLCVTLEDPDLEDHRRNPSLVSELVTKLPTTLKIRWSEADLDRNDVVAFGKWLYDIGMNLCTTLPESSMPIDDKSKDKKKEILGLHKDQSDTKNTCLICHESCKEVAKCRTFKDASPSKRNSFVHDLKLCYRCLGKHSFQKPCENPVKCTFDSCIKNHHPMLHKLEREVSTSDDGSSVENASSYTHTANGDDTRYRYMRVTIVHGEKRVQTFAFLDEGSSVTLMTKTLAKSLGLNGKRSPLCLSWTDDTMSREDPDSEMIRCTLSTGKQTFNVNARTISSLTLPTQSLDYDSLCKEYEHLKKLPVQSYYDAKPELLIGLDNWNLGVPLKIREGSVNDPIAIKCRLGWTILAVNHNNQKLQSYFHYYNCPQSPEDQELSAPVKGFRSKVTNGKRSPSNRNWRSVLTEVLNATGEVTHSAIKMNSDTTKQKGKVLGKLWKCEDDIDSVADDVKNWIWIKPPDLTSEDRWFIGSTFPYDTPVTPLPTIVKENPLCVDELPQVELTLNVHDTIDPIIDTSKFYSWLKLLRTVVILCGFKCGTSHQNVTENNLRLLDKEVEAPNSKDIAKPQFDLQLRKLVKQSPYIDEEKELRVKCRINAVADLPAGPALVKTSFGTMQHPASKLVKVIVKSKE